jgi:chemotaxis protein methyltransferase CheR
VRLSPSLPLCFVEGASTLLRRRTGLLIGASRRAAFESSLAEAMHGARVRDPAVYLADLAATPALMDDLAGRVTVGETYFFREPEQCAAIERVILPALLASRPPEAPVRIWSAGCATGEEPFTLAVIAHRLGAARRVRILGTDISHAALTRARCARYTKWSMRGVAQDVVEAHFARVGAQYQLHTALQGAVEFRYLNLADDGYPSAASGLSGLDLILCRNVLIYFDRETIARVARRLLDSLSPDGWLMLGPSDPMIGELVPCDVVVTDAGLRYRRAGARAESARPAPPAASVPQPASALREPAAQAPVCVATAEAGSGAARAAGCYAVRDYDGAVEAAREAIASDGADPAVWVILVRGLANLGELAGAERYCATSLERHATCVELQCLHALLLNDARRYDAGAVAARRALYLDRGLVVAHLALGAALAGLGNVAGAERAFGTVVRLLASRPEEEVVPASDGEHVGSLTALARTELKLLEELAA